MRGTFGIYRGGPALMNLDDFVFDRIIQHMFPHTGLAETDVTDFTVQLYWFRITQVTTKHILNSS
jgi:hypothetical protein